jgi:hypothetical protein
MGGADQLVVAKLELCTIGGLPDLPLPKRHS